MAQSKKSYTLLIIAGVLLVGSVIAFVLFRYIRKKKEENELLTKEINPDEIDAEPGSNEEKYVEAFKVIYDTLQKINAPEPETLARFYTAQAAFETEIFKSPLFLQANNAFGMKQPRTRPTTSLGPTSTGWASYESFEKSVEDRYLWDQYNKLTYTNDIKEFIQTIKSKSYFEEPFQQYYNGVRSHYAKLNQILNQG